MTWAHMFSDDVDDVDLERVHTNLGVAKRGPPMRRIGLPTKYDRERKSPCLVVSHSHALRAS